MPQIKSILCPVDFSEFSVNAYEYAQSLAWHYKATLYLQHVLYSLQPFGFWNISPDSYEKRCGELRAGAEQQLQEFATRHSRTEIRPQCFVQDGPVTDLIFALASQVAGPAWRRYCDRRRIGRACPRLVVRQRSPGVNRRVSRRARRADRQLFERYITNRRQPLRSLGTQLQPLNHFGKDTVV